RNRADDLAPVLGDVTRTDPALLRRDQAEDDLGEMGAVAVARSAAGTAALGLEKGLRTNSREHVDDHALAWLGVLRIQPALEFVDRGFDVVHGCLGHLDRSARRHG